MPKIPAAGLSAADLKALLKYSDSTLERRVRNDPRFPKPYRDGPRLRRWVPAEVEAYQALLMAERDAKLAAAQPKRPRGRPPGSRNRKTLERLERERLATAESMAA